jgi:hypothetical protein
MKTKFAFFSMMQSFREYTGEELYATGQQAHDRFVNGRELSDLLIGIDFSQLAVLDRRMQYIARARTAIDSGEPIPNKMPEVSFDENGFPNMVFFERYNEPIVDRHVIHLQGGDSISKGEYKLSVEFDWQTAMSVESSGGITSGPLIKPEQIKTIKRNEEPIQNFNPKNIRVEGRFHRYAYYTIGEGDDFDVIYCAEIKEGDDTSFVNWK